MKKRFGVLTMEREQVITRDKGILGGTPVFTGTRVPVDTLVAYLKAGDPLDTFLEDFPSVNRQQAESFLELAEQSLIGEEADASTA
jgi:uncharacterized protein (DUF433 family)